MMRFYATALLFAIFIGGTAQEEQDFNSNHPNIHKVVVKEVLQTTSYTYLQVEEHEQLQWLAVPKMEAAKGDTYYYQGGMEMVDFKSTELNRTFGSVMFLNGLISPEIVEGGKMVFNDSPAKTDPVAATLDEPITPPEGGISLKELFTHKDQYAGKVVRVRGQVTKFSSRIMNRNWIHLEDGSGKAGEYDLTVTTDETVAVGDMITVEGVATLDKDFGAGYFYSIILENGKLAD